MTCGKHALRAIAPLLLWAWVAVCAPTTTLDAGFDAANRLFEEGKYPEAAEAYERMIAGGARSAALFYNLGTSHYKAGRMGLAIVAYRQALDLAPRDASLRANLDFVRKKVNGEDRPSQPAWRDWLILFTLNEGAALAAAALWVFFLLLALREWKPALSSSLRRFIILSGAGAMVLAGCLVASAYLRLREDTAVVLVNEAVARFGPLDEAKTAFSLRDGAEAPVVDTKDQWLQVKDAAGRVGWVKRSQVAQFRGRTVLLPAQAPPLPASPLPRLTPPAPAAP